jgi:hypothetical protein
LQLSYVLLFAAHIALCSIQVPTTPDVVPKGTYGYVLSESRHFMENPSQITEDMFIGSYVSALNKDLLKHKLEITAVINCTEAPNAHPGHFDYLQVRCFACLVLLVATLFAPR